MAERKPRLRGLSLVLAGFVVGSLLVAPAAAHISDSPGHLWRNHIKEKVKDFGDNRWLRGTKTYVAEGTLGSGAGVTSILSVNCPNGWEATGGGVHFVSNNPDVRVTWNGPLIDGDNIVAAAPGKNPPATGWKVEMENLVASAYDYSLAVICARA